MRDNFFQRKLIADKSARKQTFALNQRQLRNCSSIDASSILGEHGTVESYADSGGHPSTLHEQPSLVISLVRNNLRTASLTKHRYASHTSPEYRVRRRSIPLPFNSLRAHHNSNNCQRSNWNGSWLHSLGSGS